MSVFIIAEAGINMNGRLDHALALVAAAKKAGADAVKFQGFSPTELSPLNWEKRALLKGLWMSPEEMEMLAAECRHKQIEFMCTPMGMGWLETLMHPKYGMKRIKIGSAQVKDRAFIAAVAACKLPVIISNGMCIPAEFDVAMKILGAHDIDVTPLSCVSKYPTPDVDMSLDDMFCLKMNYGRAGFSSHCRSFWPSVAAAYAGATVIEQHICLPGTTGPDISSSLLPGEFQAMVREIRVADGSR